MIIFHYILYKIKTRRKKSKIIKKNNLSLFSVLFLAHWSLKGALNRSSFPIRFFSSFIFFNKHTSIWYLYLLASFSFFLLIYNVLLTGLPYVTGVYFLWSSRFFFYLFPFFILNYFSLNFFILLYLIRKKHLKNETQNVSAYILMIK